MEASGRPNRSCHSKAATHALRLVDGVVAHEGVDEVRGALDLVGRRHTNDAVRLLGLEPEFGRSVFLLPESTKILSKKK